MKRGGILINVSAPELVDQHALETALRAQRIGGAGLDIFPTHPVEPSYPLLTLQKVVLTPHIGGATKRDDCSAFAGDRRGPAEISARC